MTTMLESAAMALMNRQRLPHGLYPIKDAELFSAKEMAEAKELVRAVLVAVREPDLSLRQRGKSVLFCGHPASDISVGVGAAFTTMIDGILNEGKDQ